MNGIGEIRTMIGSDESLIIIDPSVGMAGFI